MILELYGVSVSSRVLGKNSESGAHSCFGEDGFHILMVSPGSDTRWTLSLDSDFIKEASISGSSSGRRRGSSSRNMHRVYMACHSLNRSPVSSRPASLRCRPGCS